MIYIKVNFEDGSSYITGYNGSFRVAQKHYIAHIFTFGLLPHHKKRCSDIELLEEPVSEYDERLWPEEHCPWLKWDDLNRTERAQARESYISIREYEEERDRDDVVSNPNYNKPIDGSGVRCCGFQRMPDGYIYVNI